MGEVNYKRELDLNINISFRDGYKIHKPRLSEIKKAIDKAVAEAIEVNLPAVTADVTSSSKWSYVFSETSSTDVVNDEDDFEPTVTSSVAELDLPASGVRATPVRIEPKT